MAREVLEQSANSFQWASNLPDLKDGHITQGPNAYSVRAAADSGATLLTGTRIESLAPQSGGGWGLGTNERNCSRTIDAREFFYGAEQRWSDSEFWSRRRKIPESICSADAYCSAGSSGA